MNTQLQKQNKADLPVEAPRRLSAIGKLAERLKVSEERLVTTLKSTAFSNCKTDDEFAACVIVAAEYGLNPFMKELYAFPAKGGGIQPIVSIDGWLRIINEHPQLDGLETDVADDGSYVTCTIYRKDRSKPIRHTEYLDECKRNTEPWKQHPRRMLTWKAIIQTGRIAFGVSGVVDEDEAGFIKQAKGREIPDTPIDPFAESEPKKIEAPKDSGPDKPEVRSAPIEENQLEEEESIV